ncbi:MAG: hypothetical protein ACLFUW_03165, partial [Bacteroidales bacterium]
FEFEKGDPSNLNQILENISLVKAANYDVGVLGGSNKGMNFYQGIHIWIRKFDIKNINLMILMSYIIAGHPDWKKSSIKIFFLHTPKSGEESKHQLTEVIRKGRLPVSMKNIEFIEIDENTNPKDVINEKSQKAGLTMMGFLNEQLKHEGEKIFSGYDKLGDVLFVNATIDKQIY